MPRPLSFPRLNRHLAVKLVHLLRLDLPGTPVLDCYANDNGVVEEQGRAGTVLAGDATVRLERGALPVPLETEGLVVEVWRPLPKGHPDGAWVVRRATVADVRRDTAADFLGVDYIGPERAEAEAPR